jgi:hypothetical protein
MSMFQRYAAGESPHSLFRDFHRRYSAFAGKSSVRVRAA